MMWHAASAGFSDVDSPDRSDKALQAFLQTG
jgi:hypothetical protein